MWYRLWYILSYLLPLVYLAHRLPIADVRPQEVFLPMYGFVQSLNVAARGSDMRGILRWVEHDVTSLRFALDFRCTSFLLCFCERFDSFQLFFSIKKVACGMLLQRLFDLCPQARGVSLHVLLLPSKLPFDRHTCLSMFIIDPENSIDAHRRKHLHETFYAHVTARLRPFLFSYNQLPILV